MTRPLRTHNAHITHCCSMHGCKYGNKECPVEFGDVKQKYACEVCDFMLGEEGGLDLAYLMNEMYDKGVASAHKS